MPGLFPIRQQFAMIATAKWSIFSSASSQKLTLHQDDVGEQTRMMKMQEKMSVSTQF